MLESYIAKERKHGATQSILAFTRYSHHSHHYWFPMNWKTNHSNHSNHRNSQNPNHRKKIFFHPKKNWYLPMNLRLPQRLNSLHLKMQKKPMSPHFVKHWMNPNSRLYTTHCLSTQNWFARSVFAVVPDHICRRSQGVGHRKIVFFLSPHHKFDSDIHKWAYVPSFLHDFGYNLCFSQPRNFPKKKNAPLITTPHHLDKLHISQESCVFHNQANTNHVVGEPKSITPD